MLRAAEIVQKNSPIGVALVLVQMSSLRSEDLSLLKDGWCAAYRAMHLQVL